MISWKCKNCGGQMDFGGAGGFVCPYCGSKAFFSDADFKGNEVFRRKLAAYYKAEAEKKDFDYGSDFLWTCEDTADFSLRDGDSLQIDYMKQYGGDGYTLYLAKESAVYVFSREAEADAFLSGLRRMVFPEADMKLSRCFPELKMELPLAGGSAALVFERRPNVYPAEMFAPYASGHLAWVISRMENIACALAYAGLEHGDITETSVWVNPLTHEGALFGDWRKVKTLHGNADLQALRRTAIALAENTREPAALYRFLNTAPAADAFADFAAWDKVIETGFGGHKFVKMTV